MVAEPVQAFQGLILNGNHIGSLFSYPEKCAVRDSDLKKRKGVSLGPRSYEAAEKPFRRSVIEGQAPLHVHNRVRYTAIAIHTLEQA